MFDWDDANVDHILRHGVSVEEVEEALLDTRRVGVSVQNVGGERRWGAIGSTQDGRLLFVVFARRGGTIRVVTTRDASSTDRRLYRR